jgi:hypothetical protein
MAGGGSWEKEPSSHTNLSSTKQRIQSVSAPMTRYHRAQRGKPFQERRSFMFLILAVVLVLLWLGGFFVLHVSSFLIHLLLLFALISIIMNFVGGRRAV